METPEEISARHLKLVEEKRLKALQKAETLKLRRQERDDRRAAKTKAEDEARDERRKERDERREAKKN